MKNKSKVENLNSSIGLFIGVRNMLADNVKDLDKIALKSKAKSLNLV